MGSFKVPPLTITTFLLLNTLLHQTTLAYLEVSEAEQVALEFEGKLLPSANLTQTIQSDLAALRSKFPNKLQDISHVPEWKAGELVILNGTQYFHKINSSVYGPVYARREIVRNMFYLTFPKPYHPDKLKELLVSELDIPSTLLSRSFTRRRPANFSSILLKQSGPQRFYWFRFGKRDPIKYGDVYNWMGSVDGERNARLVSIDPESFPPEPEISDAEAIVLESSGELLPSPTLAERVASDVAAIRSRFPAVNDVIHVHKSIPGHVVIPLEGDDEDDVVRKLNSSKYGPIVGTRFPSDEFLQFLEPDRTELAVGFPKFTVASFQKPYNPETLIQRLEEELGARNLRTFKTSPNESKILVTEDPSSAGKNTYSFKKYDKVEKKFHVWTFVVRSSADAEEDVALEKEEYESE